MKCVVTKIGDHEIFQMETYEGLMRDSQTLNIE